MTKAILNAWETYNMKVSIFKKETEDHMLSS